MKHRGRSDAGFTLLELLVAMTVLGVLTALIASSLSFGMRKGELRSRSAVCHSETEDSKEVVLIDRVALAEFSFFGATDRDAQPRWRDRWQDPSKLPLLVRVHVTFPPNDRRKWPELVIPPAITSPIGAGSASQGASAL